MISKIKLTNFRKLENIEIESNNKIIILTGMNAIGKTTVLESIYIVSTSKSHRTNDVKECITFDKDFLKIELQTDKQFVVTISKEGKNNTINNINYEKISEFIGNLNVIMFSPLDLELINGSKGFKRRFLDLEISLLDKAYLREITAYKQLLKERNEILKNYSDENRIMLKVVTSQLIELIKNNISKRLNFINKINQKLLLVTKRLNCEKIELNYLSSVDLNNIEKSFENKLNYDIISKTTNVGLHRDTFEILIDGKKIDIYGSEGQMRNSLLAIKFALMEIYKDLKKDVILLLDDVFASVDQKRINNIMEYIKREKQTFITTTSIFNIPDELLKDAKIIRL